MNQKQKNSPNLCQIQKNLAATENFKWNNYSNKSSVGSSHGGSLKNSSSLLPPSRSREDLNRWSDVADEEESAWRANLNQNSKHQIRDDVTNSSDNNWRSAMGSKVKKGANDSLSSDSRVGKSSTTGVDKNSIGADHDDLSVLRRQSSSFSRNIGHGDDNRNQTSGSFNFGNRRYTGTSAVDHNDHLTPAQYRSENFDEGDRKDNWRSPKSDGDTRSREITRKGVNENNKLFFRNISGIGSGNQDKNVQSHPSNVNRDEIKVKTEIESNERLISRASGSKSGRISSVSNQNLIKDDNCKNSENMVEKSGNYARESIDIHNIEGEVEGNTVNGTVDMNGYRSVKNIDASLNDENKFIDCRVDDSSNNEIENVHEGIVNAEKNVESSKDAEEACATKCDSSEGPSASGLSNTESVTTESRKSDIYIPGFRRKMIEEQALQLEENRRKAVQLEKGRKHENRVSPSGKYLPPYIQNRMASDNGSLILSNEKESSTQGSFFRRTNNNRVEKDKKRKTVINTEVKKKDGVKVYLEILQFCNFDQSVLSIFKKIVDDYVEQNCDENKFSHDNKRSIIERIEKCLKVEKIDGTVINFMETFPPTSILLAIFMIHVKKACIGSDTNKYIGNISPDDYILAEFQSYLFLFDYLIKESGIKSHNLYLVYESVKIAHMLKNPVLSEDSTLIESIWNSFYFSNLIPEQHFHFWFDDPNDSNPARKAATFQLLNWYKWLQGSLSDEENYDLSDCNDL